MDDTNEHTTEFIRNKKAYHDFEIIEKFEAGIVLKGTEVKSIRARRANFVDTYAQPTRAGELLLHGLNIQPYLNASHETHEPDAPRKLLLHRKEIERLTDGRQREGLTIVALRLYQKKRIIKVELGLARGRQKGDKREALKLRAEKRDIQRAVASHNRKFG